MKAITPENLENAMVNFRKKLQAMNADQFRAYFHASYKLDEAKRSSGYGATKPKKG